MIQDEWQKIEVNDQTRSDLKSPLNPEGETALHLAVRLNRTSFFNGLINLMGPEELVEDDGKTAFFMCVNSGNVKFAKTMLGKNENLAMIEGKDGLLPIKMAAERGHHQMSRLLCRATILDGIRYSQMAKLFFTALESNIFGKTNW